MIDRKEIHKRFWPHPLTDGQKKEVTDLRILYESMAAKIVEHSPTSREQVLALTKLEESAFWVVAAIARNE